MKFIDTAYASPEPTAPRDCVGEKCDVLFTSEQIVPTETHAEQGVLGSLGLNLSSFVGQLISFAIVAIIVWYLILKPLTKKMAERQQIIDESLTNAKKVEENLQKSEQKYQERIDQAKVEANKILERTTVEADQLSVQMKEKAKKEIELLVDQAKRNIKIERDEMVGELKKQTADLIVAALEKILSERVDSKKDKEIIEEMLTKVR